MTEAPWVKIGRQTAREGRVDPTSDLSQRDYELTQVLLLAAEADVVVGDIQLSHHVHLGKGRPQCAIRVSVQPLVLGQPKGRAVALVLRPGVQVPVEEQWQRRVRAQTPPSFLAHLSSDGDKNLFRAETFLGVPPGALGSDWSAQKDSLSSS